MAQLQKNVKKYIDFAAEHGFGVWWRMEMKDGTVSF
jgi:hypothetical protein